MEEQSAYKPNFGITEIETDYCRPEINYDLAKRCAKLLRDAIDCGELDATRQHPGIMSAGDIQDLTILCGVLEDAHKETII